MLCVLFCDFFLLNITILHAYYELYPLVTHRASLLTLVTKSSTRPAYPMNDSRPIKRNSQCLARRSLSVTKPCQCVNLMGNDFVQESKN